jgi:cytidylate kinase
MHEEKDSGRNSMTESNLVITLGGAPGVGTTTVAKALAEKYNLKYISAGEMFRQIAQERGLEVAKLSETAEKEVDLEVDDRTKQMASEGGVIIEGDLAAWMAKDYADIKLWLTAPLETRAGRVFNDEKQRTAEEFSSLDDAKEKIQRRFDEDMKRYFEYYNIDLNDSSVYDFILDTENLSLEEVISKLVEYIESKGE